MKKYGYLSRVQKELEAAGVEHALFDEIRPNPTRKNVMDGAKAMKEQQCDFVVALGGGSVMDCSKCIALMAANPGDIWDYSLSKAGGKKMLSLRLCRLYALQPQPVPAVKWILQPLSQMMN